MDAYSTTVVPISAAQMATISTFSVLASLPTNPTHL